MDGVCLPLDLFVLVPSPFVPSSITVSARAGRRIVSVRNSDESAGDAPATIRRLRERVIQMEELTSQVAHDLKRPLVAIESCIEFLKEDLAQGNRERQERDLRELTEGASAMRRLLGELLDLARAGRLDLLRPGHGSSPPEACDIPLLVDRVVKTAWRTDRGERTRFHVQGSLPGVLGRPVLIEELFGNLVDNAVKYSIPDSSPEVEIGVRTETSPAVFYVRDRGVGIPPADRQRVFDWFVQLHNRDEGTGLGLAIAQRIVGLHGGRIWIEGSESAPGVTVCFTLESERSA